MKKERGKIYCITIEMKKYTWEEECRPSVVRIYRVKSVNSEVYYPTPSSLNRVLKLLGKGI
jgi:hypothetical protein